MQSDFQLGDWSVYPALDEIGRGGERVRLKRKAMEVLVALAKRSGDVVSKQTLFAEVWQGSWVTDGVLSQAIFELRRAFGDSAREPRVIQTVPRRGYRLLAQVDLLSSRSSSFTSSEAPRAGIRSLAVLPLVNLSADPEQEYFTDGMTEALIGDLAQIGELRVISRTSVMRFKGTREPLPAIADELGVDGIVEGSVLRSGDRVRISVQLLHAPSDSHLWARSYERELADVLRLQRGVARAIAREIQLRLNPKEIARLEESTHLPPSVYEDYLRGRYFFNQRTAPALEKSIGCFERAIEVVPTYALAWSGLADVLTLLGGAGYGARPAAVIERARSAAMRAVELDDELAEGHVSLAYVLFHFDWMWNEAEIEFRRAVELSPSSGAAHHWYAVFLAAMGRSEEAVAEIEDALELDPLSLIMHAAAARVMQLAGRFDSAIEECERAFELDPDYAEAHFNLGMILLQQSRFEEAATALQEAVNGSGERPMVLAVLAHAYARSGDRGEAARLRGRIEELASEKGTSNDSLALVDVALGDYDRALDGIEQAVADRYGPLAFLKVEPMLRDLWPNPRFQDILHRLGLTR